MTSAELSRREAVLLATRGAPGLLDRSMGQRLLQLEARCALYATELYYWLVDVAPILARYRGQQWWRDTKRSIGYLGSDLMEILDEWLG
jgi:hypothetical protein